MFGRLPSPAQNDRHARDVFVRLLPDVALTVDLTRLWDEDSSDSDRLGAILAADDISASIYTCYDTDLAVGRTGTSPRLSPSAAIS